MNSGALIVTLSWARNQTGNAHHLETPLFQFRQPCLQRFWSDQHAPPDAHDRQGWHAKELSIDDIREMRLRATKLRGGLREREHHVPITLRIPLIRIKAALTENLLILWQV
jgi:hypothetical protein